MIATAHIAFDRSYFELQYDEWLRHRSRFKKCEIWFAVALTLLGLALALTLQDQWLVGVLGAVAGIYEFVMAATHKRRWVNARLTTIRPDKSVVLEFDGDSVKLDAPNSSGTMQLVGFRGFTPSSRGFFLIPDTGVSIYVPRAAVEPSDAYPAIIELLSSNVGRG